MSRRGLRFVSVGLPVPVDPQAVRGVLLGLYGLPGRPRLVLEVVAEAGSVRFRLGAPAGQVDRVRRVLSSQVAGVRVTKDARPDRPVVAADVLVRSAGLSGLAVEHAETVLRGLYGVLASTRPGEVLVWQAILGERIRPRPARSALLGRPPGAVVRVEGKRLAEAGFGLSLRLAAGAASADRAVSLISQAAGALRGMEGPGVVLRLRRTSVAGFVAARSPWLWSVRLPVGELALLLGWPMAAELPGLPGVHPRLLPVPDGVPRSGRILGVGVVEPVRPVGLPVRDGLRHLHVLGPTGVGKSVLLAQLVLQDAAAGRSVVLVDPKGDLVDEVLARLPAERLPDVVVIDGRDGRPVGINGLAGAEPELAAETLLAVFRSLYADSWGPRTQDILSACLLTLARRGDASLVMVPLLLTNAGFRRSVVGQAVRADPLGLGSFWAWFDGISEAERQTAIAPLMNKLRSVLMRPRLRAIFGQRRPRFDLGEVFTKRRILLVSLAKGTLGAEAAALLGSIVVALLWQAALGRVAVEPAKRHPVMVAIDEVQDYLRLPGDVGEALALARGLGVGFTLAHQYLSQLPTGVRAAVLGNARSRMAFSLGLDDARVMAAVMGSPLEPADFARLPAFQAYGQLLTRGEVSGPFSLGTRPFGPVLRDPAVVRRLSAERYGRALDEVERDLLGLVDGHVSGGPWSGVAGEGPLGRVRRGAGS